MRISRCCSAGSTRTRSRRAKRRGCGSCSRGSRGSVRRARRCWRGGSRTPDAWKRTDARSAAEHLAKLAGSSLSEAQQLLQTSKRVEKLALTAAAIRRGELSPGKAHAIADAASVVPEDEAAAVGRGAARSRFRMCGRSACARRRRASPMIGTSGSTPNDGFTQHKDAEGAWKGVPPGADRGAGRVQGRARTDPRRTVQAGPGGREARTPRGVRVRRPHRDGPPRHGQTHNERPNRARRRSGRPRSTWACCASISKHCCAGGSKVTRRARSAASDPIPVTRRP